MTETESVELLRCVVDAPVPSTEGMTSAQAREQRMICGYNKIPAPSMLPPSLCCLIPCLKQSKARRYFDIFVPDTCCVKRNGKWIIIDSLGVVTGDLVKLTSGQHAAADLKIIEVFVEEFLYSFEVKSSAHLVDLRIVIFRTFCHHRTTSEDRLQRRGYWDRSWLCRYSSRRCALCWRRVQRCSSICWGEHINRENDIWSQMASLKIPLEVKLLYGTSQALIKFTHLVRYYDKLCIH